ncbi:hypothetical protein JCM31271_01870 [Halorubrum trueperi]
MVSAALGAVGSRDIPDNRGATSPSVVPNVFGHSPWDAGRVLADISGIPWDLTTATRPTHRLHPMHSKRQTLLSHLMHPTHSKRQARLVHLMHSKQPKRLKHSKLLKSPKRPKHPKLLKSPKHPKLLKSPKRPKHRSVESVRSIEASRASEAAAD